MNISAKRQILIQTIKELSDTEFTAYFDEMVQRIEEGNSILPKPQLPRANSLAAISDDFYPLLRNARLATFSLNDLLEGYFGEEPDGTTRCGEKLMIGFYRAEVQATIAMDYIQLLAGVLERLDSEANGYTAQSASGDSGVLQQP